MSGVLADLVVVLHFAFILFALFGGLLVAVRSWWLWLHLPALGWGAATEFFGIVCPLTYLENWLRSRSAVAGYQESFIEHYLVPIVYPQALTPGVQMLLGTLLIGINLAIYGWIWRRTSLRRH